MELWEVIQMVNEDLKWLDSQVQQWWNQMKKEQEE